MISFDASKCERVPWLRRQCDPDSLRVRLPALLVNHQAILPAVPPDSWRSNDLCPRLANPTSKRLRKSCRQTPHNPGLCRLCGNIEIDCDPMEIDAGRRNNCVRGCIPETELRCPESFAGPRTFCRVHLIRLPAPNAHTELIGSLYTKLFDC